MLDGTGRYIYTDDLRRLSQLRPVVAPTIPPALSAIATPLRWQVWESELRGHPDREFVQLIVGGILDGFRIGYDYSRHSCRSCGRNMVSASQHPEPIQKYIATESVAGRIIGPVPADTVQSLNIQISRFGIIPKPHQPGK